MLIDTHTHLFVDAFDEDRQEMLARAREAGVHQFLLPNIDTETIAIAKQLSEQESDCKLMMGLHPCSVKEDYLEQLELIQEALDQNPCVAVGEIGIDLYWDKTFLEQQKDAFRIQCEWAKERKLPIAIHARDSFPELFEVLDQINDESLTGVFHCFTGGMEEAEKVMGYGGFMMGIGGVITFKKSGLDKTVKDIPMEYLVLETDSPYLAPTPYRGKRNESAYLRDIAQKLADVKEVTLETVAVETSKNARKLFALEV
ncbi:MAG: TatD family hydrolase [Flavobacteriales bacterium]|nr:TatD family hydrolase [Flavobacteriales bacterium]